MSLIQFLDQGLIRMFKVHYTRYSMKKKVANAMEKNSDRENIMKLWKDYTIEGAVIVVEKVMKAT